MEITSLGDCAMIVRICDRLEEDAVRVSEQVLATMCCLERAQIPGVIEITPAYTTVAIYYDPIKAVEAGAMPDAIPEWLAERVREALADANHANSDTPKPRSIVIPVCYGGEYGPDLKEVACFLSLSTEEIVRRHSGAEYLVHCIGFSPGFAYLGGLASELAVPRRAVPRKRVPSGSVGIGGSQTGIYPLPSPGGWNLIGRTPLRLFSPEANPPALLQAGDRLRFRAITAEEFEAWDR